MQIFGIVASPCISLTPIYLTHDFYLLSHFNHNYILQWQCTFHTNIQLRQEKCQLQTSDTTAFTFIYTEAMEICHTDGGYINMGLPSLYMASNPCQFPLVDVNQCKLSHDCHYQISCEQNSQATGREYREFCWSS